MEDDIPEELKRLIQQQVDEYNNMGDPDFEGYSPKTMGYLLYNPFDHDSPVQFNRLSESDLDNIPLFRQIYYLASLINEMKEIKLTATGRLPVKIVADLRNRRFLYDTLQFQDHEKKVYREDDSYGVTVSRLLLEVCGITKKSAKKLELTGKGKKLLANKVEFFRLMFEKYTMLFNWAYGDSFEEEMTGQLGWAFSVALIAKYGHKPHTVEFYSQKYFKAFPQLPEGFSSPYAMNMAEHCYQYRFFNHFMCYFGLVGLDYPKEFGKSPVVKKTPLFDRFIRAELKA